MSRLLLAVLLTFLALGACRNDPCKPVDDSLIERLDIRGEIIGASLVDHPNGARYLVVSVDYNVAVWATDIDTAGEGNGVIVPANDTARAVSEVGLDLDLPRSHPVAIAAADRSEVEAATICEAPRD